MSKICFKFFCEVFYTFKKCYRTSSPTQPNVFVQFFFNCIMFKVCNFNSLKMLQHYKDMAF